MKKFLVFVVLLMGCVALAEEANKEEDKSKDFTPEYLSQVKSEKAKEAPPVSAESQEENQRVQARYERDVAHAGRDR